MNRKLDRRQILERRQALLNKLFPGDEEANIGNHKFTALRGVCTQCGLRFTDWVIPQPDGTYRAGIKLCPVIGPDEVAKFRDYDLR